MRVHVVTLAFPPEPITSARVASDLADELASGGHEVTVFCPFPNRPEGRVHDDYRRRTIERTDSPHYRIVRTWHSLSLRSNVLSRTMENVTFGLTSSIALLRAPRADVAFVGNWPLFAQLANALALRARGTPIVVAVKDLYPETIIADTAGAPMRLLGRLLRRIDGLVCSLATTVTTISAGQRAEIIATRGIDADHVIHTPDWLDGSPPDLAGASEFRETHGLGSETTAVYAGSITGAAGLDVVVDAARALAGRDDVRVVLVGDGAERERLETRRQTEAIDRLTIVHPLPVDGVGAVHGAADMLIVSLAPGVAKTAVPSKLVSYLFAGKPIIACVDVDSSAAEFVRESGAGVVTPAGDAEGLAEVIDELARRPEQRAELGRAALDASRRFERDELIGRVVEILERAATQP